MITIPRKVLVALAGVVAKTFEDVEEARANIVKALDRLDCGTEGGLKTVLDEIKRTKPKAPALPPRPKGQT